MTEKYELKRTSLHSAVARDKVLYQTTTTRVVLRPEIVDNPHKTDTRVKVTFVHQRKTPKGNWEDRPTTPLSTLRAGQEVKLALHTEQTLELFNQLENLYAIATEGKVGFGETSLVVGREEEVIQADASRTIIIKLLLAKGYSDHIWKALVNVNPDLATQLSYARIHAERQKALDEFRANLRQQRREDWWQSFFEKNTWIFGYGLRYQILKPVQAQPHYGGQTLGGKGTEKGDFLQRTEAQTKFTVLVEIKKPDTALLAPKRYRNAAWQLGEDLTGGVTQLQANCRRWEIEGSRTEKNRETLSNQRVSTVQPKGILVMRDTAQLSDVTKKNTFELFRRNITNPEILTFDELFERAKFIVERTAEDKQTSAHESTDDIPPPEDDVPF